MNGKIIRNVFILFFVLLIVHSITARGESVRKAYEPFFTKIMQDNSPDPFVAFHSDRLTVKATRQKAEAQGAGVYFHLNSFFASSISYYELYAYRGTYIDPPPLKS